MRHHTLFFPSYLTQKNEEYFAKISARLYEHEMLKILRKAKHEHDVKTTAKYLIKTMAYKQPSIQVQCNSGQLSRIMQYDQIDQRFTCNFSISKSHFEQQAINYNHLRLLPVTGSDPTDLYYLINLPDKGVSLVSDIDDTIIQTEATKLISSVRSIASGYQIVRGMDDLYMQLSKSGFDFHYVTSSPDVCFSYFYPLIEPNNPFKRFPFGTYHSIPTSRSFLRSSRRKAHKIHHILQILSDFPNRDFVFVGDSGQQDIDIYTQILKIVGIESTRIKGIYIRDLTNELIHEQDQVEQANLNVDSPEHVPVKYFRDGAHLAMLLRRVFDF